MGSEVVVNSLEDLYQFLNDKGVLEIALRGKYKRFVDFQKVVLNNVPQSEAKEMAKKAINLLNKNNAIAEKSLRAIRNISKLQSLSIVLSGLNLCATCAGFAIMYDKLEKMSGQINQVINTVKQGNEVRSNYEFNQVLSEHRNMLDCRRKQKYYDEDQMRKLIDWESNVLKLLLDQFLGELTENQDSVIFSIYSLASMMAVSIRYFDELYYFNNKETINEENKWHASHNDWISLLQRLASNEVMQRIQDHGFLDLNLSTVENDMYYTSLHDQILSSIEDIKDNQDIIVALDNQDTLAMVYEKMNGEIASEIKKAFEETTGALDQEDVVKAYNDAVKQLALAV